MDLDTPRNRYTSYVGDFALGIGVLAIVVAVSVFVGLRLEPATLSNWGGWLGAFVAGIAMVCSAYAIILQSRQGESASWNIALARLGQIYDLALLNQKLARIIAESPSDAPLSEATDLLDLAFTPQETVWLGSLFLAFEQIYVATNSLSPESQRVWRLYLKNQLNKPTIRTAFVRDASSAKDFHHGFWKFVRGDYDEMDSKYRDFAIHPSFFVLDKVGQRSSMSEPGEIVARAVEREEIKFWMNLYSDPEVKKQMYSPPLDSEDSLWNYLQQKGKTFTVWDEETCIGGFTLTDISSFIGSFGIVIDKQFRGRNYGKRIMYLLEQEARKLGYRTLRADVYNDNLSCIRLLGNCEYRKFIWLEKNI